MKLTVTAGEDLPIGTVLTLRGLTAYLIRDDERGVAVAPRDIVAGESFVVEGNASSLLPVPAETQDDKHT
jgi:hypothetical protein